MTVSGDFIPDDTEGLPSYPTVLGLTLTPSIQGLLFLLLGIAAAVPLYLYLVQPAQQTIEQLQTDIQTKETTLRDQEANLRKVEAAKERLEAAKQKRKDVLQLFADQRSLEVVLLDIDRQIKTLPRSPVKISDAELKLLQKEKPDLAKLLAKTEDGLIDPNIAILKSFTPAQSSAPAGASSYGEALKGKLIEQNFALRVSGDFQQVIQMLRRLEEQRLVMNVSNFSLSQAGENEVVGIQVNTPTTALNNPKLDVTFTLQTVVPTAQVFGESGITTPGQPGKPPAPGASPSPGASPAPPASPPAK